MLAGILFSGGLFACGDGGTTEPVDHESHPVASLEVDAGSLDLAVGSQATLTATAMCEHGVVIHPEIAWSTGDAGVATVDAQGIVGAVAYGNTTVSAMAGSVETHVDIHVAPEGTVVGVSGGTVASQDGALTLEFPAGALDAPTDIQVEKLEDGAYATDPLYVMGTAYRIRPEGLQLQERARLRIRFQEEHVPAGVPQERLRIQERLHSQDRWQETEQNQLQAQERQVEAQVQRLGVFGIVPSHAAMVGAQGGTVTSADGRAVLEIPAGALTQERYVAVHRMGDAGYADDPMYVRGTAYELSPLGEQLQERARLRIHYDPANVPQDVLQERLRIQERDREQQRWSEAQQNQVRLQEHAVEAETNRFGVFAIVASTGGTVGTDGGTVVSADGVATLVVPAGALTEDVEITLQPVEDAAFADDPNYVAGTAYELSPDGLEFQEPANLQIHYDPANVPGDLLHERLRIRVRDQDGQGWQNTQRHRLRKQEHVVEADIAHLSVYAVVGLADSEVPVVTVTVDPPGMSLTVGQTGQFTAAAYDGDGFALERDFNWTTSAPSVATVGEGGQVSALAVGSATITAEVEGVSATATLVVSSSSPPPPPPPPPGTVESVTVTPSSLSLGLGETGQLSAVARDAEGNALSRSFTWSSSDQGVATVSSSGLVTAVAEGTATITAATGGVTGSASVVVNPPISSVVITDPGGEPVEIGFTLQLTATAYDSDGVPVEATFEWSTSDEAIATVDATGLVTGTGRGTATITAAVGTVSDAVDVKVVGESGTYGNNLSWPVIFADGVGLTGLAVSEETGLRPLAAEGVTVDALPFFWEGNEATYGIYYEQMTFNTWQAEWVDGSGEAKYDATITWGDNLTHQTWSASRPIRVEEVLSDPSVTMVGYNMFLLYGSGQTEMQGSDGTTADFNPTIYTDGPTLTVQKLSGEGGSPVATVTETAQSSEVNVAGKVIYGYNLRLSSWTPPAGGELSGWYRITFTLNSSANVRLTAVGNTGDELVYLPEVGAGGSSSWVDIYVEP